MNESSASHDDDTRPRVQFGLRSVLIAPVVLAVFLGLLKTLHIYGVVLVLAGTVVLQCIRVDARKARLKRLAVDLLEGIVLPLLCLFYDQFVFRDNGVFPVQVIAYLVIGFQMLVLLAWLLAGPSFRVLSGVFAGSLFVGALFALGLGLILLPMSLIGAVIGIGLLGLTPFFTAHVFATNGFRAMRCVPTTSRPEMTAGAVIVGVLLAIAVPALLYISAGEVLADIIRLVPRPPDWGPF